MRGFDVRTGKTPVDLSYGSQRGRVRLRHRGALSMAFLRRNIAATQGCGRNPRQTKNSAWPICRSKTPPATRYGGPRPGPNLFSDSLVAVDIKTGARKWYYQTVHHDIWDLDIPAAPILANINVEGKSVKAVIISSKQGYVYVLDRVTGKPVRPIPEMPVPAGDVPGEWYSPTQPIPSKPPALGT